MSKFEEARIEEVRKTTNWNHALGEQVRAVLGAGKDDNKQAQNR